MKQETLRQCTPALFEWTPTTGPYYLSVTSSGRSIGPHIDGEVITIPHATSASWIVDVEEGRQVTVLIKDSNGQTARTVSRTVMPGPEHCL
jgi:hypothetical protein